jgi:hypothetical protein
MDAGRLLETAKALVSEEATLAVTSKIQNVINMLSNVVSQPQQPAYQVQLREALDALENVGVFTFDRDPVFASYASSLGAESYSSSEIIADVENIIDANAITPAAAQQDLQNLLNRRSQFFNYLNQLQESMTNLGVEEHVLALGETQIGFRIPRDLFQNQLQGWIDELKVIRRVLRAFSELATGAPEDLELGEISTTDPLIFILATAPTVAAIGKAVSWSLDQWKKVEEIRKVRAETSKINDSSGGALDTVLAGFDAKIKEIIDDSIKSHAKELVSPEEVPGRQHEQVTDIEYALRALVARIERGMTVELRFLPSPAAPADVQEAYKDIAQIMPALTFPQPSAEPTILLEGPNDADVGSA